MNLYSVLERDDRVIRWPVWLLVLVLLLGIAGAAYALANFSGLPRLLGALVGLSAVIAALYGVLDHVQHSVKLKQPPIKPAANPASSMKDEPVKKD